MIRRTSWFLVLLWCAALCSDFLHAQIASTDEAAAKPFDDDEREAHFHAILNGTFDNQTIDEVAPRFVASYVQDARRSRSSLDALRILHKRDRQSVEPALPCLAAVIENTERESELYYLCDLFLRIDHAPKEVVDAVTKRFDFEKEQDFFATARGAALLVRFSSDTATARIWLEVQTTRSREYERVTVTDALSYGGIAAKPSMPKIKKLLEDDSHAVRSAAAWAVWQIDRDADIAVPALLASLEVEGESYLIHRISPSSWYPDHRMIAVHRLGQITERKGEIARKIVPLLNEEEPAMHYVALLALADLGESSPEIIDAIREKTKAKDQILASKAEVALRRLTEKRPDND